MSNFQGRPYLRVLTPRTTDGTNIMYDEDMRVIYKESHFEMSAKEALEKENLTLPRQLRHIIKVVGVEVPQMTDAPFVPRPQRVPRVRPQLDDEPDITVMPAKVEVKAENVDVKIKDADDEEKAKRKARREARKQKKAQNHD